MNKFIDALSAQIDPQRRVRAKPMKLMAEPITLTQELDFMGSQTRYYIRLNWNVGIWLDNPGIDSDVDIARKEAMNELIRLIYGELWRDLSQLKYVIKYCGDELKANELLSKIMEKVGMS